MRRASSWGGGAGDGDTTVADDSAGQAAFAVPGTEGWDPVTAPPVWPVVGSEALRVIVGHPHARSGDRLAIAAYLGKGDAFDQALTAFAEAYADQNERDFERVEGAAASGEVLPSLAAAVQEWNVWSAANPGLVGLITVFESASFHEPLTADGAVLIPEGSLLLIVAAIAGDTRWVRPKRPCRPSKLRLDVEAQRSRGLS